ncbi:oxygen-independent coproporphyrinogen III oxidase, partial [Enterobacter ludwigii]|uniref:oxygen-independent coproporphyrinogen III oxidase n=1 Tax=Enterobacter ludwigii TaxID=299767 RepID=UPI000A45BB60
MSVPTIDWDLALIQKYNYSGPRYTSYPTALEFSDSFGEAAFQQAVARYPERPLSLYVHIPFCHKLCYFCGCNKIVTRQQHKADQYLDALEQEILHRAPLFAGRHVSQLHWGGGTPTYLNKAQISRLMTLLRNNFRFNDDAEISIEVDPREIELDVLDHLRAEGFNRLSMGVQDFNKEVQRLVNREQDEEFIFALLNHARDIGFTSTNIDLIYGLPKQTPESFAFTLGNSQLVIRTSKVIHADELITGFGQRGDGFLQNIQLLLGRRQVGIFDFALSGKQRRQMRIVKDAQAVRVEFGHAFQREGEA